MISTEAGDFEGAVGEWLGVPMFCSSHDPETVKQLIGKAGFSLLETDIQIQVENDVEIPYLWVLAKKK